jgi:pimeloyl-ACP methyl ester carboxylesterase
VNVLVTAEPGAEPRRVLLLFSGKDGLVGARSLVNPQGNFLVRSRAMFVGQDIATAVLNVPSDQWRGMSGPFRTSPEHATDIGLVMDYLKTRFPKATDYYLVGTSMGTISAAYAGRQLQARLKGIVLTSEVLNDDDPFQGLTIPVLLVHHLRDGCKASPYYSAQRLARTFKFPLVTVTGGKTDVTGPCEPGSAHGYWGKEAETVEQILRWIHGEPVKEQV